LGRSRPLSHTPVLTLTVTSRHPELVEGPRCTIQPRHELWGNRLPWYPRLVGTVTRSLDRLGMTEGAKPGMTQPLTLPSSPQADRGHPIVIQSEAKNPYPCYYHLRSCADAAAHPNGDNSRLLSPSQWGEGRERGGPGRVRDSPRTPSALVPGVCRESAMAPRCRQRRRRKVCLPLRWRGPTPPWQVARSLDIHVRIL
jgi:hypothetical protein